MTTSEFNARIDAMLDQIAALPECERAALQPIVEQTRANYEDAREAFGAMQSAVSDLHLNIQYMKFDIEATRRELASLREQFDPSGETHEDFDPGELF